MPKLILLNKPFNVLCQFTSSEGKSTLADFIKIKNVYAAGRLDYDSEGLVVLTDSGKLQHLISDPKHKFEKTYWVQVEGIITKEAVDKLSTGVKLKDGITKPAKAVIIDEPQIWERIPPIRERKNIPTSWLSLTITEGRNRQVRRMTAAVGFPTLRLIRYSVGTWNIDGLALGEYSELDVKES